jgi:hypothetical protein
MCVYAYIHDRYLNILAKRSKYYGPANIMVEFSRLVDFSLRGSRLYDCPLGYPKIKKMRGVQGVLNGLTSSPWHYSFIYSFEIEYVFFISLL